MRIDVQAFIASVKFLIEGWLGIFAVMGVIMAVIICLNRLTSRSES